MISDILFSGSIGIKELLRLHPELYGVNSKEILKLVNEMETLRANLEVVPVITNSLAENESVTFGEKRPDDGQSILAIVDDINKTHYALGYYKYEPNVRCNHQLYGSDGQFFAEHIDTDKWVKSTKTLEELNLDCLMR